MSAPAADHRAPVTADAAVARASIDPRTSIGSVALTVADLGRARAFYERVLGLRAIATAADGAGPSPGVVLSDAAGEVPLIVLYEDPEARAFDPNGTGLFHLALLVPSRLELARSVQRIVQARWPLTGASDHLVSEALYLRDPDGNGIEVYADRPRSDWPSDGRGSVRLATLPLDLQDILSELDRAGGAGERDPGIGAGTRIGHVHLQVGEIAASERFYSDLLGFDVTVRSYPGALFVSAGGYHHHIGLNTWQSLGAPSLAPGGIGLRQFELALPDDAALAGVLERLAGAGISPVEGLVRDPSGIAVVLRRA